jgi:Holliday junction resolvase RusA-like endonuclease
MYNDVTFTYSNIVPESEWAQKPYSVTIWIPGNPPTAWGKNNKQISVRGGRPFIRKSKAIMDNEAWLTMKVKPYFERELVGPLKMRVTVVWPYLTSHSRAQKESGKLIQKTTAPDGDNVLASIKDVMEKAGFYKNDAQIYCETIDRYWGEWCGIRIELSEVAND